MAKSNILTVVHETVETPVMTAVERVMLAKHEVLMSIRDTGTSAGDGENSLINAMKHYVTACGKRIMNASDAALVWETYADARNAVCLTGKVLVSKGKKCAAQVSEIRAVSDSAIVAIGAGFIDGVMLAKRKADTEAGKAVTRSPSKSVYEAARGFRDHVAALKAETPDAIRAIWSDETMPAFVTHWISKETTEKSEHEKILAKLIEFSKVLVGTDSGATFSCLSMTAKTGDAAWHLNEALGRLASLVSDEIKDIANERQAREFEAAEADAK